MGGSSVPSSTTQTTMLDPTRQAALKQAMGYANKWAENYKGPTYRGPLTAGRTSDWYSAQNMAHKMANRFSEGGITSVRRFDDGGYANLEASAQNAGYSGDLTDTGAMQSYLDSQNASVYDYTGDYAANNPAPTDGPYVIPNAGAAPAQTFQQIAAQQNNTVTDPRSYTVSGGLDLPYTPPNYSGFDSAEDYDSYYNSGKDFSTTYSPNLTNDQLVAAQNADAALQYTQPPNYSGFDSAEDYDSYYNSGKDFISEITPNAANIQLADAGLGSLKSDVANTGAADTSLDKAIADANLTKQNDTPNTTTTNMGSPYLLANALTLKGIGGAYRLGSDVSPKQISNSYNTPDKFTPDTWNQAAIDTYMSPYTKGVVDIALREAERQRAIERLKENTAATQSGAFGGYRQGVVEAEGERNYNQLLNDITTKGYQSAYTDAANQFAADRTAKQNAYTGNQQALQTAATLDANAAQNNQNNAFQAFTNQLAALNQGVNNTQNLSALETAYQNAMGNSAAALNSTDASARASDQAYIDAISKLLEQIANIDLTKAQGVSGIAGIAQNPSNTQVKVSS